MTDERMAPNIKEVCARLRCSRSRVFELLAEGKLRRHDGPGRETLIDPDSIDAYVASLKAAPAPRRRRSPPPAPMTTRDSLDARRARLDEKIAKLKLRG